MRNLIRALIAALSLAALPVVSDAAVFVGVSVNIAPPELPVYVQPPCPAAGYIWIPGYWGPHVGFYGGVNYGFGYGGEGYEGGRWRGNQFYYNRSVTNISNTNITNVYNRTVVNNVTVNRVSFNGGAGGVAARPSTAELRAAGEHHVGLTPVQRQHEQKARGDTTLRASVNGGRPPIAATQRPAAFSGRGVVAARGAAPAGAAHPAGPAHGAAMNRSDRPPQAQRPAMTNRAGGPQADRPPQAQRPAIANRAGGPQADRPPQAQRPAITNRAGGPQADRPMMNQQRSPYPGAGRAGPEPAPHAAPGYPQGRGPAQPGGAPAHQGAPRERQGSPRPGSERREEHGRGQ